MNNKYKYLLITVVAIAFIGSVIYYFATMNTSQTGNSAPSNNYSSYFYLNPISNSDAATYKASCKNIPLEAMFQTPDAYKGQKIKETGRIDNMTFNPQGYTEMLLYTPETDSNFTRLFVTYHGTVPYNIGDNIAVYGQVDTFIEYDFKMPFLKAVYIENS